MKFARLTSARRLLGKSAADNCTEWRSSRGAGGFGRSVQHESRILGFQFHRHVTCAGEDDTSWRRPETSRTVSTVVSVESIRSDLQGKRVGDNHLSGSARRIICTTVRSFPLAEHSRTLVRVPRELGVRERVENSGRVEDSRGGPTDSHPRFTTCTSPWISFILVSTLQRIVRFFPSDIYV